MHLKVEALALRVAPANSSRLYRRGFFPAHGFRHAGHRGDPSAAATHHPVFQSQKSAKFPPGYLCRAAGQKRARRLVQWSVGGVVVK